MSFWPRQAQSFRTEVGLAKSDVSGWGRAGCLTAQIPEDVFSAIDR